MGKKLVIVESPAKARTIAKFLGSGYEVDSSIGHIRDLPGNASQVPAALKKESWSRLGVNVDKGFEPLYVIPSDKKKKVTALRQALKHADELLLATDEDREGEAISWHLVEVLKPKVPYTRLVFHEITKEAIAQALKNTRDIDERLVSAQETRRILDRLYGYEVSPLLWKKIKPKLSAGRVQSVAIKILVDRERARMRFREAEYWDLEGVFTTGKEGKSFEAKLISLDGLRVAGGKDFDPDSGKLKAETVVLIDRERALELVEELLRGSWSVDSVQTKPFKQHPAAPFITSTLQQEGSRKLRFSARRTMRAAQRLYENGFITYMRTDSPTLSEQAITAARNAVSSLYDNSYLSPQPRQFKGKVKNAQEAHEAIRPAGDVFRTPQQVKGDLGSDEFKLYELIWKRTMASQMAEARGRRMTLRVRGGIAQFQATGKTIDFAGFLRVYVEGSDDPDAELADREMLLPAVSQGEALDCSKLDPKSHFTQPPARLTEATLVKDLEANGIGRPSTYASIIDTIERRDYTYKKGTAIVPSFTAFAVVSLLEKHFPELVDIGFTASMEGDLDSISRGEEESLPYLTQFYFGNGTPGLRKMLEQKVEHIDAREVCSIPLGDDEAGHPVVIRVGRYGPYLERGEDRAPIPDGTTPDELTMQVAVGLLESAAQGPQELGTDPKTGLAITLRDGRFGPYVQLGEKEGSTKPKTSSLLKGMTLEGLDLETALQLLRLPRTLGQDPGGVDIVAANGRYGPYIKRGTDTRSLDDTDNLLTLTLERALALLAQPKKTRRAATREPLRVFEKVKDLEGLNVKLLEGRFGPYVTDGTTNASIPRGTDPGEVTEELAVHLILERRAKGPVKKKKTTKKKATKKKTSKKKTTKKTK